MVDVRLDSCFRGGRRIRVFFHACDVQKPILSLGCLANQSYWSDLRADTGALCCPDNGLVPLHNEGSSVFRQRKVDFAFASHWSE